MKGLAIVLVILMLGGLAGIVAQLYGNSLPNTNDGYYSGKVIFEDKEGLADFKRSVADEKVEIITVDELNSDYPVVVSFNVKVPYQHEFKYGEYEQIQRDRVGGFVVGGVVLATCIVFLTTLVYNGELVKGKSQ